MGLTEIVARELDAVRRRSLSLTDPLSDDDLCRQHSPLMSPLVWDLAHVGNYEDQWLLRAIDGAGGRPELDDLYDAFQHPRATRSGLTLLPPDAARVYIGAVRDRVLDVLERASARRRATAAARRLRLRHGDPARAPARRDDAGDPTS